MKEERIFDIYVSRIQRSCSQGQLLGMPGRIDDTMCKGNHGRSARILSLSKTLWRSQMFVFFTINIPIQVRSFNIHIINYP